MRIRRTGMAFLKRVLIGGHYRASVALHAARSKVWHRALKLLNLGHVCNVCDHRSLRFDSDEWHLYSICPVCQCQVRHRLFWAAVNMVPAVHLEKILQDKRVLHFSPYYHVSRKLRKIASLYTTADYLAGAYDFGNIELDLDISNMPEIASGSYDALLAFDVLEHVKDHFKALDEIHRVLAPGGYCILIVPQQDHLEKTMEDPSITDPRIREKLYGRADHLRMYGLDFKEMIEQRGFEVTVIDETFFTTDTLRKHILFPLVLSDNPIATNYRKVYFGRKTDM